MQMPTDRDQEECEKHASSHQTDRYHYPSRGCQSIGYALAWMRGDKEPDSLTPIRERRIPALRQSVEKGGDGCDCEVSAVKDEPQLLTPSTSRIPIRESDLGSSTACKVKFACVDVSIIILPFRISDQQLLLCPLHIPHQASLLDSALLVFWNDQCIILLYRTVLTTSEKNNHNNDNRQKDSHHYDKYLPGWEAED